MMEEDHSHGKNEQNSAHQTEESAENKKDGEISSQQQNNIDIEININTTTPQQW